MTPVLAGLLLGVVFGAAARAGRFCLLRGMKGLLSGGDLSPLRAFALALAVAIIGAQGLQMAGLTDLAESLPMRPRFSWVAMLAGGAIFGVGMVLANACGARSVVLAAGGNLRSVVVLACLGLTAQASLTGVLAPLRLWMQSWGVAQPQALSLAQVIPAPLAIGGPVLALLALAWPLIRRTHLPQAAAAVIVGATVAAGWWITAATADPFDPPILTSVSFVGPVGDGLLWLMLSTGRALVFGVAVVGGTFLGAFGMTVLMRDLRIESFTTPRQTVKAIAGGVLMGFGGVLALGCSIGQGLSGVSTLSLASLVAFAGILAGIAVALIATRHTRNTGI
ncbi:MAG: YeeE/YedE family protein [Paracoccus sp. (in: a-proteobacteria)]|uniref:YeeE/YedE family protein n=1 Tax=Paracoccus sp. TaxID=267 RepID=UPI0026DF7894|nr:YeeE/YedE family protein [Paracoccus sp. (in: a-proteobacteria)]MDO5619966.1 YeeE/YedE family protein [Paracoccus sp. (in: a-proteobacteria)]